MGKDTKFTFFMVKTADDKIFMPVFTDGFEFGKMKLGHEWNAAVFSFSDIARFIRDKDGVAIGSGGNYAYSAAVALYENTDLDAEIIVRKSLEIASNICVYTNNNITVEKL